MLWLHKHPKMCKITTPHHHQLHGIQGSRSCILSIPETTSPSLFTAVAESALTNNCMSTRRDKYDVDDATLSTTKQHKL